jgi:uncharacterized Zn-binding protein involved in type VI secretion
MAGVHRNGDSRACGASTIASNPNVFVNNKLAAVDGNPNSHGGGNLNAANPNVFIGNKLVVINGNSASPDALCPLPGGAHCAPSATSASGDVFIGG